MADMTFKEFCRQKKRMCDSIASCSVCEFDIRGISCIDIDDMVASEAVGAAEVIVAKWAQEHTEGDMPNLNETLDAALERIGANTESCTITNAKIDASAFKTYEQGLEDAWELAKRLSAYKGDCMNALSNNEIIEIYGTRNVIEIMNKNTPLEAMQKLQEWEYNNSFKAGDIVTFKDETKAIVMDIESDETVVVFTENGCAESGIFKNAIRKTGRNVADKLNELLKEIRMEQGINEESK